MGCNCHALRTIVLVPLFTCRRVSAHERIKNDAGRNAERLAYFNKLDDIQPALADFNFRDIGLGFVDALRQRALGQTAGLPSCNTP